MFITYLSWSWYNNSNCGWLIYLLTVCVGFSKLYHNNCILNAVIVDTITYNNRPGVLPAYLFQGTSYWYICNQWWQESMNFDLFCIIVFKCIDFKILVMPLSVIINIHNLDWTQLMMHRHRKKHRKIKKCSCKVQNVHIKISTFLGVHA